MQIDEIYRNVFHLKLPSQYLLAMTFIRMQEFYESPFRHIRRRYFTLDEYMDTYSERFENFSYTIDNCGFNVPGSLVCAFYNLFFIEKNDLTFRERDLLLSLMKKQIIKLEANEDGEFYFKQNDKKFYLIGTFQKYDLKHEVCHAFYYLYPDYKNSVLELLKKTKKIDILKERVLEIGYCKYQLIDECQAYLSTADKSYAKVKFGMADEWYVISRKFKKLFKDKMKEAREDVRKNVA